MTSNLKNKFQNIHYDRHKPGFCLSFALSIAEFFYKNIINTKNFLYEKNILKEEKLEIETICIGNLTTGGVGKTPIVTILANKLSQNKKVAIISRGYGAKLSNKTPNIIKDFEGLKFQDGRLCGDEPFQLAKKVSDNVIIITCKDRKKAINLAIEKYGCEVAILDDGFSNRKVKKDKIILAIDSKMRFGNNHLLPYGPLREPIKEIKRADEIILVDKDDKDILSAIEWVKKFNLDFKVCKMRPKKIYNAVTKAKIVFENERKNAVAFCAIGQPQQFYSFLKQFYNVVETLDFSDHHKYSKKDIEKLIKIAKENNTNTFITTQKDETKLYDLIKDIKEYSFNVLELENIIE